MRRFLKIFSSSKRARETKEAVGPPAKRPLAARSAHRPNPRIEPKLPSELTTARKGARRQAPEAETPEFSGLIERRATDFRGLMPEPYKPEPDRESQGPSGRAGQSEQVDAATSEHDDADLDATGRFLAAFDNSSITLADSGVFRVRDDKKTSKKRRYGGRFDPYDGD
ncbi:MAG: hypothetical protein PVG24_11265 [Gammaproteobacteria bacterium]|jgi:hypothetical protein